MPLKENRALAWAVLGVCALGSIFGLGGHTLAQDQDKLLNVFYEGTDTQETTRHSMDAYLDRAAECASVMGSEAQLLLSADNATAQEMIDLSGIISDSDDLTARYDAYCTLQKDADTLYNAIYAADLTDAQRVSFKQAYDDFWGSDKYIKRDSYRSLANEFNSELSGFPAGLAAGIWNVDEMDTFGG